VFIGDDVYLENEYPERVDIQNGVTLGLRSIVVAHGMGGPGRVVIEDNAFIGCNSLLITSRGRTLTIGEGSVVMAGSVVTANVPPFASVGPSSRESVSLA
jgi:acetyltransferase-like isoleucine patch superfamily enzyme